MNSLQIAGQSYLAGYFYTGSRGIIMIISGLRNLAQRSISWVLIIEVFVGNVLERQAPRNVMKGVSRVFKLAGIISIRSGTEEAMRLLLLLSPVESIMNCIA